MPDLCMMHTLQAEDHKLSSTCWTTPAAEWTPSGGQLRLLQRPSNAAIVSELPTLMEARGAAELGSNAADPTGGLYPNNGLEQPSEGSALHHSSDLLHHRPLQVQAALRQSLLGCQAMLGRARHPRKWCAPHRWPALELPCNAETAVLRYVCSVVWLALAHARSCELHGLCRAAGQLDSR